MRRRRWPALLALFCGSGLSALLFLLVHQNEREKVRSDFMRWAQNRQGALESTLYAHLDMLHFVGALFFSSRHVDRKEFHDFAQDSLQRLQGIRSLEWLARVGEAERASHEARVRAEGFSDYQIVEHGPEGGKRAAAKAETYYPVVYALPSRTLAHRLGLDRGAVPQYAAAMQQAILTPNQPILTHMQWTNSAERSPEWRAFLAVYTNGQLHATLSQRQQNVAGFVSAELKMRGLAAGKFNRITNNVEEDVLILLKDKANPQEVIYRSPQWPSAAWATNGMVKVFPLEIGTQHWELVCLPTRKYLAANRDWQAWALLGASLLLSVLVAGYLYSLSGRELKINQLVRERTNALTQANQDLQAEVRHRQAVEKKLDQERYLLEALMDSTPDHIYFKDRESRFLRVSKAQAEWFKVSDPTEIVGKKDSDFFTDEHAQNAFNDEAEIMRTGKPMVGREEKETWADGTVSWVSTTKQCLRDKQGQVIGTFGISRDITAHKLAEEALARKTEELIRSNQELEQFAYVASHDLQEPLRMIASYTQLLSRRYKGKLDADADEFIGYAVGGAERMQTLINDLLTYSRVDRRGKPFAPTDCGEALQRALENLKVAIDDSGAVVECDPLPQVMADDVQLTQLFQNLVSNAIKFHGDRSPEIKISATLKDTAAEMGPAARTQEWVFQVQDNGIGIEPEYFDRIFVIFQRLHTRDQYSGTGIGLAICKKIVERHGGRMWVESQLGQGCTFYFTIPKNETGA